MTVIPGNHDAYVRSMIEQAAASWGDYMCGDGDAEPRMPFVRRRAGVALIGVSTAMPRARSWPRVGWEHDKRPDWPGFWRSSATSVCFAWC